MKCQDPIDIVNDHSSYCAEMDEVGGNLRSREISWNTVVLGRDGGIVLGVVSGGTEM